MRQDDNYLNRDRINKMAAEMNDRGRMKYCQRCKRLFPYSGFGHIYCSRCKEADERDFEKVKDYLYDHPGATMLEVEEGTGVIMKHITTYLREGRLEIPQNSPIFIKCEMCKGDIRYGRVCPACADRLTSAMKEQMNFDAYQIGEVPKRVGKMRFLDRDKGE